MVRQLGKGRKLTWASRSGIRITLSKRRTDLGEFRIRERFGVLNLRSRAGNPTIPYPLLRFGMPNFILTAEEMGRAMLAVARHGAPNESWRAGIFALYCIPNSAQDTA